MSGFWLCSGGSSDAVLGVSIYGRDKKWWHDYTIMPLYRIGRYVNDAKWWLKYRFVKSHRYHIVYTDLEPGYHDEDERILHACFALLEEYIKWHGGDVKLEKWSKELETEPDKNAPAGLQKAQADRQLGAVDLYRWWKIERPADEKRYDDLLQILYGDKKRMRFEKVDGSDLYEIKFDPFDGDEKAMHKEFRALEKKISDDEQKMLHRLIDIRPSLWT